jgi:3-deoxy-7-phosphoheptulonate synthase
MSQAPPELAADRSAHLVHLAGKHVGRSHALSGEKNLIGRLPPAEVRLDAAAVSREHACIRRHATGEYVIEDVQSKNGTFLNGERITGPRTLCEGDKIRLGDTVVLRFTLLDVLDRQYQQAVEAAISSRVSGEWETLEMPTASLLATPLPPWSVDSWQERKVQQEVPYQDTAQLAEVVARLRRLPPLVTSWEVEELKDLIAEAQEGRRFLIQGGDCAETLGDCNPDIITNKLKILIQLSLVLIRGTGRPVIRVGRLAGQYAKPRSRMTETRDGIELPSYLGDLVNRPEFTPAARAPDPNLLLAGYQHAGMTLNFIRALSNGAFSDLRRKDYFDLSYFESADLPTSMRHDYNATAREITSGLQFMRAVGDRSVDELMKVSFFTSHEGLNLHYESAQTRQVPHHEGYYDLTTHMPWIGDRTRAIDGAHVEFFRGVENPIGLKVGPSARPEEILHVIRTLNPRNERGKIVLITRFGAKQTTEKLPLLVETIRGAEARVLWVCDPMHGNGIVTPKGVKTRNFDDILDELERTAAVHHQCGTTFGGVHFELTGEDVTECIGGGLGPDDLTRNYATVCDPRLNYRQALQMAFCLAECLKRTEKRLPTLPPPRSTRFR